MKKKVPIGKIIIFIISFVIISSVLLGIKQYFAKPPTLSKVRSTDYSQIIQIVSKHEEWGNFSIWNEGGFRQWDAGKDSIDSDDRSDIDVIVRLLKETSTMMVFRDENILYFKLSPRFPFIKVPGYIYSKETLDLDKTSNHFVKIASPLCQLSNGWYSSADMNTGARLR